MRACSTRMAGRSISRMAIFRTIACLLAVLAAAPAVADSSSPRLAAYYDHQLAIVDGVVYAWRSQEKPRKIPIKGAVQVGVGSNVNYVLTAEKVLLRFGINGGRPEPVMTDVGSFAAGQEGVLAIKPDASLWWLAGGSGDATKVADSVVSAAVGDGANYYVTDTGALFVKGKAHRGQYGDGKLQSTDKYVKTADNVAQITAHTGHAILLTKSGDVLGTGGNIYGPVGRHGLGDKAVRWSKIMSGARRIATGSSNTFAIRQDGMLMAWGRSYGPEPVAILAGVAAVAAGSSRTFVRKTDGTLWYWHTSRSPRPVDLK